MGNGSPAKTLWPTGAAISACFGFTLANSRIVMSRRPRTSSAAVSAKAYMPTVGVWSDGYMPPTKIISWAFRKGVRSVGELQPFSACEHLLRSEIPVGPVRQASSASFAQGGEKLKKFV